MADEIKHQIFLQKRDGELIPTDQFTTIPEWEATKFCFDTETLFDHTKYFAWKQIDDETKHWLRITSFSLI